MKVLFSGGGTMGSVSPLLAIYDELKEQDKNLEVLWLGTKNGTEKEIVLQNKIKFSPIFSGKLRRYFSLQNLIDPFKILIGYFQSKKIIKNFNPDIILTSGSFVCVPVAKAGKKMKIPVFIHQQDIQEGLANKIMEKYATKITITFDKSLNDFDINKTFYTSNPVRKTFFQCNKEDAYKIFNIKKDIPTILVMGGGLGAQAINQLTLESLGELSKNYQVVHITGKGKKIDHLIPDFFNREEQLRIRERYFSFEFISQGMCEILKVSDLVISRAGISSLTELSILGKAVVLIPIPNSHQEKNAEYYAKYNSVEYLKQNEITSDEYIKAITSILNDSAKKQFLEKNISQMIDPNAAKNYVELIKKTLVVK